MNNIGILIYVYVNFFIVVICESLEVYIVVKICEIMWREI